MMIKYEHHGKEVWVSSNLKGHHKKCCLCWSCDNFIPNDREKNCKIANLLFSACQAFNIVTPVWECPEWNAYVEKKK